MEKISHITYKQFDSINTGIISDEYYSGCHRVPRIEIESVDAERGVAVVDSSFYGKVEVDIHHIVNEVLARQLIVLNTSILRKVFTTKKTIPDRFV